MQQSAICSAWQYSSLVPSIPAYSTKTQKSFFKHCPHHLAFSGEATGSLEGSNLNSSPRPFPLVVTVQIQWKTLGQLLWMDTSYNEQKLSSVHSFQCNISRKRCPCPRPRTSATSAVAPGFAVGFCSALACLLNSLTYFLHRANTVHQWTGNHQRQYNDVSKENIRNIIITLQCVH